MSTWDWFDEYEWRARCDGNSDRARLGTLHREAYRFRESDPDRALALLAAGRALAQRLGEPWWLLYYDQQRVHALLHFKQDYREVLEPAVRNTLEVGKPTYIGFPRRLLIHGDLISAYLGIDPLGHAEAIRAALEDLDSRTPPEGDDRYLLLGSQRQFALEEGCLDRALAFSQQSLRLAAEDLEPGRARHFLVFCYSGLCEIAWRREDWDLLTEAARAGEEAARTVGHQIELAGFWLWQALVHRRQGRDRIAEPLHRQAVRRLASLRMPPDASLRDAECAFHELAGRDDLALEVRSAELAHLEERGRIAQESACWIKRIRLLHRLDLLRPGDITRARAAAERLRCPGDSLAEIARIERGEGR